MTSPLDLGEEAAILARLTRFAKIHVARPAGQNAVLALKRQGKVDYVLDNGIMVVTRRLGGFSGPSGGDGLVA